MKNRPGRNGPNRTSSPKRPGTEDRRVRRTKASLESALFTLAHEKPYPSIAVKEILSRANVGRSTFYGHYKSKDDLLRTGIGELLERLAERRAGGEQDVLAFSLPILQHIDGHRRAQGLALARASRSIIHQHLERVVTEELTDVLAEPDRPTTSVPLPLVARHLASTFVLVLNWWVEHEPDLTPEKVDARFRALAGATVAGLSPARPAGDLRRR